MKNDLFRPCENGEELLGLEVLHLSAIGALMCLANYTCPYIVFSINLLAKHSFALTRRHCNDIKHILCNLQGTNDMGIFY